MVKSSENSQNVVPVRLMLDRMRNALQADSDTELAQKLGVSQSRLSNWLVRGRIPDLSTYCGKLGLSVDWVLNGTGSPWVGKSVFGVVKEPVMSYGASEAEERLRSSEVMVRVYAEMPLEDFIATLIVLGKPPAVARELAETQPREKSARLAVNLLWVNLGYPVERLPV